MSLGTPRALGCRDGLSSISRSASYSIQETADMLSVDYFSVSRLNQRGKLKACRALRGKFLIARSELLRMLQEE